MSDTQSIASEDAARSSASSCFIEVEETGKLVLGDIGAPTKKIVLHQNTLAVLLDDGNILLGSVAQAGGRYLDMAVVANPHHDGGATLLLLAERKNKEKCLSAHHISHMHGQFFEVGEAVSCYDKSNVLGKGVSHVSAPESIGQDQDMPTIFTVSNLVRKIKLEDAGSLLKPTPARAQVPNDCQDGTLAMCVQSSSSSSKKTGSAKGLQHNVVLAFRTKSMTGKNKFAVEWYTCNRKDELSNVKTASLRLNEDSEPVALLSDPRDSRGVYAVYNNKSSGSSSICRMTKSANSIPIVQFNHLVHSATMGLSPDTNNLMILTTEVGGAANQMRVYTVHKTDGFRSRHPGCARCQPLEEIQSPAHVLSCVTSKWRLSSPMVDEFLMAPRASTLMALASLCINDRDNTLANEPDSGNPYRVRVLGCPVRGMHPEAILLEDLDQTFDGDFGLSGCVLKICLGFKPCRGCYSLLSSWLMSGKLAAIEMHYIKPNNNDGYIDELPESERFSIKAISPDKFRSYVADQDWTQQICRPSAALIESTGGGGTFTLEPEGPEVNHNAAVRPMSASVCSTSRVGSSRIPTPRSTSMMAAAASSASSGAEEDLVESNQRLRALVQRLATTLTTVLDVDVALRNNLMSLHETLTEVQNEVAPSKNLY